MDPNKMARQSVAAARSIVVLSGAGISAESGVPTFRGDDGLWKQYRAEDLATPAAFRRDPELVWAWYQWRRQIIATKHPNAAHRVVVQLEETVPDFMLITQNVDGLHAMAGSRKMIELHGNIWKLRCTQCNHLVEDRAPHLPSLPKCGCCAALLRPHIVWFGESIDPDHLDACMTACRSCEVILVVGTSSIVQPAASFAAVAKSGGATVVEINPNPALGTTADISLVGPAAKIFPDLIA